MIENYQQAANFLMQASLGASADVIVSVSHEGVENWLEQQLSHHIKEESLFAYRTQEIWNDFRQRMVNTHGEASINGDGNNPALAYKWYFHMAWWEYTLGASYPSDMLRQRIAQALSELLVISDNSSLELNAVGMASYYDILYENALGDYVDILYRVSMHPCMGVYLSHMNNQKAQPDLHIHPDENYAREIMQLFSIGLFELNPDGTRKIDANGDDIPTYDNDDIKELARVFTGLTASHYEYEWSTSFWPQDYNGTPIRFDDGVDKSYKTVPFVNMTQLMRVDENYHDRGRKQLLNGQITLPGNQDGATEIRSVVEQLVAHPNTAVFVAKHLIQQLVTSNPSAKYVMQVAEKFGKRGNMQAVIREILTYPLSNPVSDVSATSQKLKSPLLRVTQLLRGFNAYNQSGKLWLTGEDIQEQLQQHPLSAPTVFNFYKPDFTPHGPVEEIGMVAPEFELHTSATSIAYVNLIYYWIFAGYLADVSTSISNDPDLINIPELSSEVLAENFQDRLHLDYSLELEMAADVSQHDSLIDRISLLMTGKTQLSIKAQIKDSFSAYRDNPKWVVQTIIFMLAISPEYTVLEV